MSIRAKRRTMPNATPKKGPPTMAGHAAVTNAVLHASPANLASAVAMTSDAITPMTPPTAMNFANSTATGSAGVCRRAPCAPTSATRMFSP